MAIDPGSAPAPVGAAEYLSDPAQPCAAASGEVLLHAEGIGVDASWGRIYGPVDVDIRRGGVTVLVGSGGRGRTALLLTLAGRMKPSRGAITAFGATGSPRRLFRNSALGFIDEVDGIGQTIRVRDIVTEQLRWSAPWYKFVGVATDADLERLCRPVFGPLSLPSLDAFVEELPELTNALFRVAMANTSTPPLLVVGGVDKMARTLSSTRFLERLLDLGRKQTVITANVNGVAAQPGITDIINVHNLTDGEFVRLEQGDALQ